MSKLTETQTLILSRASQQADRIALPLPDRLRGGAANKVIVPLIKRGLLDEVEADIRKGEPTWRKTGDGHGTTLVITDAGLAAIGVETETPQPDPAPAKPKPRSSTKQAMLIEMLEAPDGATIAEITAATGWQPHTVRGAISGALKKRLGLTISSEKVEGRGRTYKIAS
ncbi:DUF3489 domain-containing protein [Profundibacter sp.]|uniref:DUF3489 domain-containing protein n=1 Tax=Profundibacter sp. TaxID=3101071 RepID=UPI003D0BCA3E